MDVVNFSEGILGIDQAAAPVVARYLRQLALVEEPEMFYRMNSVAKKLESGQRVEIGAIREIGEEVLSHTKQLCLNS